jgi:hypothetical protein
MYRDEFRRMANGEVSELWQHPTEVAGIQAAGYSTVLSAFDLSYDLLVSNQCAERS